MQFLSEINLKLTNIRSFNFLQKNINFEKSNLIFGSNGSGKTTVLSSLYSLFTKRPFTGSKFKDYLKLNQSYFGIQASFQSQKSDWFLNASLSPAARLKKVYQTPADQAQNWPKALSYIPEDNLWLKRSRQTKLTTLDNLLTEVFGEKYNLPLRKLNKSLQAKQEYFKKLNLNPNLKPDQTFLISQTKNILQQSLVIWKFRLSFFKKVKQNLDEFLNWIEIAKSDNHSFFYQTQNLNGFKIINFDLKDFNLDSSLNNLIQVELRSFRNLFGAQKDDFSWKTNQVDWNGLLSRGQMRLFVLFLKKVAFEIAKTENQDQLVFWFLDDVFNEFDDKREKLLLQNILLKSDWFIASHIERLPQLDIDFFEIEME